VSDTIPTTFTVPLVDFTRLAAERDRLRRDCKDFETTNEFLNERINDLYRELAEYKSTAPLCAKHQPTGGSRATCLVCALIENNASLSRIDYICGPPNEMEVSGYDVHCEPELVIKNVERLVDELRRERECQEAFAKRIMGEERFDMSPCQAHPLQLVEEYLNEKIQAIRFVE